MNAGLGKTASAKLASAPVRSDKSGGATRTTCRHNTGPAEKAPQDGRHQHAVLLSVDESRITAHRVVLSEAHATARPKLATETPNPK